jgi:hypothetical protein
VVFRHGLLLSKGRPNVEAWNYLIFGRPALAVKVFLRNRKKRSAKAKKLRRAGSQPFMVSDEHYACNYRRAGSRHPKVPATLEAPSGGAVGMHTMKGQVAVITGAAGGIVQASALDMVGRGAACIALGAAPAGPGESASGLTAPLEDEHE